MAVSYTTQTIFGIIKEPNATIGIGNRFGLFALTYCSIASGTLKRKLTNPISAYYNFIPHTIMNPQEVKDLEASLQKLLPNHLHAQAGILAQIISGYVSNNPIEDKTREILPKVELDFLLKSLEGQKFPIKDSLVSFGEGNQLGDVSVQDIVGGNKVHYSIILNYNTDHVREVKTPEDKTPHLKNRGNFRASKQKFFTAFVNRLSQNSTAAITTAILLTVLMPTFMTLLFLGSDRSRIATQVSSSNLGTVPALTPIVTQVITPNQTQQLDLTNKIVYAALSSDGCSVYAIAPGAGTADYFSSCKGYSYSISPDKSKFVYSKEAYGGHDIFVSNIDETDEVQLTFHKDDDVQATWSPDGKRIAFVSLRAYRNGIYVMNMDGTQQERLTETESDASSPAWSPDGKYIAYVSNRDETRQVYIVSLETKETFRITRDQSYNSAPVWSPDGKYIAYLCAFQGQNHLCLIKPDGSGYRTLILLFSSELSRYTLAPRPSWSPDSSKIVFVSKGENDQYDQLYTISILGSNLKQVTFDDTLKGWPSWQN